MTVANSDIDKCNSFVISHLMGDQSAHPKKSGLPFVTISREAGAGARTLARKLQSYLDSNYPLSTGPWTLFDKNLVETAMKEHGLPERFAKYLPEGRVSELKATIGELVGLHPSLWELNKQVSETLLNLAHIGGVILVGRGAHVLTRASETGLHLRLVGGLEYRTRRAAEFYDLSDKEARTFIEREDKSRRLWVKDHYDEDIGDPSKYDLTINTDTISMDEIVSLINCLFQQRFPNLRSQ